MKSLGTFILTVSLALWSIGCGGGDAGNGASNEGPSLPPEAVPDSDTVPVAPDAASDDAANVEVSPDNGTR